MNKHEELFALLNEDTISTCVTEAFDKLNNGLFKNIPLSSMTTSKQVLCGLFHELIVHEISNHPNWRAGRQKTEADLVHSSGLQLQVKTSTNSDGIAGNRYASENEYSDPSEYYLCVNFIPFVSICKIRAGFLPSSSWKPQTGKGNSSTLKKEVLDILPFINGPYLQQLPLLCIKGIGEKMSIKLKNNGYFHLNDIKSKNDFQIIENIIKNNKISELVYELLLTSGVFLEKEVYNEENLSLLRI